jgi:hypothetical protein
VALGHCTPAAAATPASASGSDEPAGKNCVGAEEAGAYAAAHGDGGTEAGGTDEGAPPRFNSAFYARTITLDASLDGVDGKQLPISIEEVCDIPKALAKQSVQLAGADGIVPRCAGRCSRPPRARAGPARLIATTTPRPPTGSARTAPAWPSRASS